MTEPRKIWMNWFGWTKATSSAEGFAYDDEVMGYLRGYADKSEAPPIHLTERYLKVGGDVAEKRVTQAGYRLGAVLNGISSRSPDGCAVAIAPTKATISEKKAATRCGQQHQIGCWRFWNGSNDGAQGVERQLRRGGRSCIMNPIQILSGRRPESNGGAAHRVERRAGSAAAAVQTIDQRAAPN